VPVLADDDVVEEGDIEARSSWGGLAKRNPPTPMHQDGGLRLLTRPTCWRAILKWRAGDNNHEEEDERLDDFPYERTRKCMWPKRGWKFARGSDMAAIGP